MRRGTRSWPIVPALLLAALAPQIARSAPQTPPDEPAPAPGVAPMYFQGRLPVSQATINGQGPFYLGVDSGGGGPLLLTDALIRRLQLPAIATGSATDGSGLNPQRRSIHTCAQVEIGGLSLRDVAAMSGYRNNPALGDPIDGVCGLPLFSGLLVTFDYASRRITFEDGPLPEPDGRTVLALEPDMQVPAIAARIGTTSILARLDTRNTGGLNLPERLAERVAPAGARTAPVASATQFNQFQIWGARLGEPLLVGAYEFADPPARFAQAFEHANIGSQILEQFTVTFDMDRRRVRLVHDGTTPLHVPDPPPQDALPDDLLEPMVGRWRITGRSVPGAPGTPEVELSGTATWERDHAGKVVHERFTLDAQGTVRAGETFLGRDLRTGGFQIVSLDSYNFAVFQVAHGTRDIASGTLTLDHFHPPDDPSMPPRRATRLTIRFEPDGSMVRVLEAANPEGGWSLRSELRYTRE